MTMKKYHIPIYIFILIMLFSTLSNASERNLIYQKVKDGNYHYYIIHTENCVEYDPIFPNKKPKIDFIKLKYYKYCSFCIDDNEAEYLNKISLHNISNWKKNVSKGPIYKDDIDYINGYNSVLDLSNRSFHLYYKSDKEGNLIRR